MEIPLRPLTPEAFSPFGQVIQREGAKTYAVNGGACMTYADLAAIDPGVGARTVLHIQVPRPRSFPIEITMLERHPLGTQAFVPLTMKPFVVIVAGDDNGPGVPLAFLAQPGQGINLNRNVWHHTLTAIHDGSEFLVIDRDGAGVNFERVDFDTPYLIRGGPA